MMTEDDLREQLRQEAAFVRPPGDLIPTLASGHARRHRRAARMRMGGVAVATVLVATGMTTVFSASGPSSVRSATAQTSAEIIQRAKEADTAAEKMIVHATTTEGDKGVHDGWAQRSSGLSRITKSGVYDTVRKADGTREEVDYTRKVVLTFGKTPAVDSFGDVVGSGMVQPKDWYAEPSLKVDQPANGQIRLTMRRYGMDMRLWLDSRTYLPARAEYGTYETTFEWLPPTNDNLAKFAHEVPPDFPHEDGDKPVIPPTS